jgi:hypothetical protein
VVLSTTVISGLPAGPFAQRVGDRTGAENGVRNVNQAHHRARQDGREHQDEPTLPNAGSGGRLAPAPLWLDDAFMA